MEPKHPEKFDHSQSAHLDLDRWKAFADLSSDERRAVEVRAMRAICDLNLIPPPVNTLPDRMHSNAGMFFAMAPSIAITPGGRLWASWVGGEDGPTCFAVAAISDDNGDTWSDTRLAVDANVETLPVPRGVRDPMLWVDPEGSLWIFFLTGMNYSDGRDGIWALRCRNPDADEPEWEDPVRIWHGGCKAKPIVLSTGEWMLSATLVEKLPKVADAQSGLTQSDTPGMETKDWNKANFAGPWGNMIIYPGRQGSPEEQVRKITEFLDRNIPILPMNGPIFADLFPELDSYRGVTILVSSDQGKTWQHRASIPTPDPWWQEPQLLEKKNGDLWVLIRQCSELRESFSTDQGFTWSAPEITTGLRQPSSLLALQRLQSGNVLLIKNGETPDTHEGRSKLTAWISEDDGQTWRGGLMLDERNAVSYPEATQAADGTIHIVHDHKRGLLGEILHSRVTEAEILEGKLSLPTSRVRGLLRRNPPPPTHVESAG